MRFNENTKILPNQKKKKKKKMYIYEALRATVGIGYTDYNTFLVISM